MEHQNCLHFLDNQAQESMMGFIVETQDGKTIVIDGGTPGSAQGLLQRLREITGSEKPVVDAWFLTHPHIDHTGALIELVRTCPEAFEVKKLYYNFPSRQFLATWDPVIHAEHIDLFYEIFPKVAAVCDTITQGDVYQVGEARFDILYTTDAAFTEDAHNNSSAVIRLTLAGQTVLFLADLGVKGGEKLLAMYGEALRSDFVQMAHHGQNGVEKDVYAAIAPKACLWCTPQWLWDNDAGLGYNTHQWKTIFVQEWMKELGVQHHYVMKDGSFDFVLPYAFN